MKKITTWKLPTSTGHLLPVVVRLDEGFSGIKFQAEWNADGTPQAQRHTSLEELKKQVAAAVKNGGAPPNWQRHLLCRMNYDATLRSSLALEELRKSDTDLCQHREILTLDLGTVDIADNKPGQPWRVGRSSGENFSDRLEVGDLLLPLNDATAADVAVLSECFRLFHAGLSLALKELRLVRNPAAASTKGDMRNIVLNLLADTFLASLDKAPRVQKRAGAAPRRRK